MRDFKTIKENNKTKEYNDFNIKSNSDSEKNSCRICLVEDSFSDNPLVSPCNCSGTMKYLHIKCLQNWLRTKLKVQTHSQFLLIEWRKFECDLCQFVFPGRN